jgi:hypothetical protein
MCACVYMHEYVCLYVSVGTARTSNNSHVTDAPHGVIPTPLRCSLCLAHWFGNSGRGIAGNTFSYIQISRVSIQEFCYTGGVCVRKI